ncbi:MAG TPA: hypothetical protein VFL13_15045 [Candidatus Baltobacteraceae bacterium]|nr:hypothetical protein [Candidatus Baltobacteraceae bacterium]
MTPVVLLGGLMSGVYGAALGEFGLAFGSGMLLHGFRREWFSWLHAPPRNAGSMVQHAAFALVRGLTIMVLCLAGCAIASRLGDILHMPSAALWAQGLWSGVLVDSMLVTNDGGSKRRRKTGISERVRELTAAVTRVHGTPAPAAIPA